MAIVLRRAFSSVHCARNRADHAQSCGSREGRNRSAWSFSTSDFSDPRQPKQNVNAFANLRPQHFTDAVLMRAVDTANNIYVQTAILQDEENTDVAKKSPLARVLRGYYLLDEIHKNDDGTSSVSRRFWFDRVGLVRLARQQIFDAKGEIESDIVYGTTGNLGDSSEYANLPLQIEVTRPKEKYKMKLTYQAPETVSVGRTFPQSAFVLQNTWNLEEVDLDKKLQEAAATPKPLSENQNAAVKK